MSVAGQGGEHFSQGGGLAADDQFDVRQQMVEDFPGCQTIGRRSWTEPTIELDIADITLNWTPGSANRFARALRLWSQPRWLNDSDSESPISRVRASCIEGHLTIAQRFNAGFGGKQAAVPKDD